MRILERFIIAAVAPLPILGLLASAGPVSAASREQGPGEKQIDRRRLAVLPFMPRGAPPEAWARLREVFGTRLPAAGFDLVDQAAVNEALKERRLRDMSFLTHAEVAELAATLGADRVLAGYIYRFDDAPRAAVSFSGRLIDPARPEIEWMGLTVVEGRSLLGPLGTGGPITLRRTLEEAARRFAGDFAEPTEGARARTEPRLLKPSHLAPEPSVFLSPRVAGKGLHRIVVLPFRNLTRRPGAGQAAADILSWCLLSSGSVAVVDAGDATRRLLERGWRTGMPVGREEVLALGRDPGVDGVLMGSVERWLEADPGDTRSSEIAFSARLLDAATGEILWAADHERRGDQTRIVYDVGHVRLAEALMARASSEALAPLVNALKEAAAASSGDAAP